MFNLTLLLSFILFRQIYIFIFIDNVLFLFYFILNKYAFILKSDI